MTYEFDCKSAGHQGCGWKGAADSEEELMSRLAEDVRTKHKVANVSDTIANFARQNIRLR
jgi:predicted small metal-binding protein